MIDQLAPFSFAGATVDITPVNAVPLAGYSSRRHASQGVSSRLEGNAVLLGSNGQRVLFVSADILFFGSELAAAITRRAQQLGLSSADVVLTASHTHFAPATDRTKPLLGEVDGEYYRFIEERLLSLVDAAMASPPVAVALELSRVETELNIGRRRSWPLPRVTRKGLALAPSIVMAPAPAAERDASLEVIRVVDAAHVVRAVLWKFACHPVCFPEAERVSSEFPGHARTELRHNFAREIPVVFWQGFAGDVRPRIVTRPTTKERLLALRRGPSFGQVTLDAWKAWADKVANAVVSAASAPTARRLAGPLESSATGVSMSTLIDPDANPLWRDRTMRIQSVSFGSAKALFVGAEVCSPYLRLLQSDRETIFVSYAGDVYGYLPSARQAEEGGYEGGEFFESFGLRGRMRRGFEDAVRAAVRRLSSDSDAVT